MLLDGSIELVVLRRKSLTLEYVPRRDTIIRDTKRAKRRH